MPGLASLPVKIARALSWPVRRFFGPQFAWVRAQVVESDHRLHGKIDRATDEIDARVARAIEGLGHSMVTANETNTEALAQAGQELRTTADWLADVQEQLGAVGEDLSELRAEVAELRAEVGAQGAGRRKASPATATASTPAQTVVAPYVFRALAAVEDNARVLAVGGSDAGLPLSLAALGYRVTAVGRSGRGGIHPDVEVASGPLERWDPDGATFDAVVVLPPGRTAGRNGDGPAISRRTLDRVGALVDAETPVVLAIPFGAGTSGGVDQQTLDGLLQGWRVADMTIAHRSGPSTWRIRPEDEDGPADAEAVALVVARPLAG